MITPVSHVTPPIEANQPNAVQTPAKQSRPQPAAVSSDTVHISAAALALQEATETPAQTAKEASAGDLQAKRLLAREAAEKTSA